MHCIPYIFLLIRNRNTNKCCSYIAEIISNAAKVSLYNSANTVRDAGVPENKILKTKKDADNYFTK